jgi:hypothetical protein
MTSLGVRCRAARSASKAIEAIRASRASSVRRPLATARRVDAPDRRAGALERLGRRVDQAHREAGVGKDHRDAAAHRARADDGGAFDRRPAGAVQVSLGHRLKGTSMISEVRPVAAELHAKLERFMREVFEPGEKLYWEQHRARRPLDDSAR